MTPGPDPYEREIEALAWSNLEAFTGEALFPVARQARISGGGIPDILALDESGRVVVIEVKRDMDRSQLAQCYRARPECALVCFAGHSTKAADTWRIVRLPGYLPAQG